MGEVAVSICLDALVKVRVGLRTVVAQKICTSHAIDLRDLGMSALPGIAVTDSQEACFEEDRPLVTNVVQKYCL